MLLSKDKGNANGGGNGIWLFNKLCAPTPFHPPLFVRVFLSMDAFSEPIGKCFDKHRFHKSMRLFSEPVCKGGYFEKKTNVHDGGILDRNSVCCGYFLESPFIAYHVI